MSQTKYNPERTKAGDAFNQDADPIIPNFDSGQNLSEENKKVADAAREDLSNE